MDGRGDTELQHFDSQFRFLSSPPGDGVGDVGDDGYVMDSPMSDNTQLMNLDFGTESVEVVVDSEDESGGHGRGGNGYVLNLRKRRLSTPCQRTDDFGSCGGKEGLSGDFESVNGGKDPMLLEARGSESARLNCLGSDKPGNSSQVNALEFVDQLVSLNNVGSCSSQGVGSVKMISKSSPVLCVKGVQRLAKKLGNQTGNFEWDDSPQCEVSGSNSISKWAESSLRYGFSEQKRRVRNRKDDDNKCQGEKTMVSSHEGTMNSVNFVEQATEHSKKSHTSRLEVSSSYVEDLDQQLYVGSPEQTLEDFGYENDAIDMFDIGFNTQMAAEAIEALAYTPVTSHLPGDVYQVPMEALDFPNALTNNEDDYGQISVRKGSCSGLRDVATEYKRSFDVAKRVSRRTSTKHQIHHEKEGLDVELVSAMEVKTQTLLDKNRLSHRNSTNRYAISGQNHPKSTKLRKARGFLEKEQPLLSVKQKKQSKWSSPVAHRTRRWMSEKRLTRYKSEANEARVNMNSGMEFGVFQIRRKRSVLTADQYEVRGRKKQPKWRWAPFPCTRNDKLVRKEQIGLDSAVITSCFVTWSHPKRKRTHMSKKKRLNGTGSNTNTPFAAADDSQESTQKMQLAVYTRRPRHFSEENTEGSSNASNVVIGSMTSSDAAEYVVGTNDKSFQHHKKTCNKSLPKPALSKELAKLGVSEPVPDFTWKHLRRPWGIPYVRVLFSQHLGDDIVKQQKKIMSRLGISIASCSTDATHFIADRFTRTRNMLESIVLGKPVVTRLWLESCGQAGCLIDEKKYILKDRKKEKEIGFSMPTTLARASQYPLLKAKRVVITPSIKPDEEMISSLVKAACGQVVDQSQHIAAKNDTILDDLFILSCKEDRALCEPFIQKGAAVYSSELLLNGIVIQKLEYERHQLFTTYVESCRSKKGSK